VLAKLLLASSAIALGPAGEAQLLTPTSIPTGLWAYSAGAGQQFGSGVQINTLGNLGLHSPP
jgi:hypothetical protein